MYYIMMLSLSMEIIPEGKAGLFDGMVGLGAAVGAFLGPYLADKFAYLPGETVYIPIFIITAVLFLSRLHSYKNSADKNYNKEKIKIKRAFYRSVFGLFCVDSV